MTEQERFALQRKLAELIGPDEAGTLMEHLPPIDWHRIATKDDLDRLQRDLTAKFDGQLGTIDSQLGTIDSQLGSLQTEIKGVRHEVGAQGTALRGEMSELRGDLRTDISKLRTETISDIGTLRSEMNEFRTDISSEMNEFRTDVTTQFGQFRTEILVSHADSRSEFNGRLGQLEERIGDKISTAQRNNLVLTVGMMLSIWLSIAAF